MSRNIIVSFLLLFLIVVTSLNVFFYVHAQEVENPLYNQLFNIILADPDLDTSDGTVREANAICDPQTQNCHAWQNFNDGQPDTFTINWAQVRKGTQACPEPTYGFSQIDENGNATCAPVQLCYITSYDADAFEYNPSNPRKYCTGEYFIHPSLHQIDVIESGPLVCCQKWFTL